MGLVDDKKNVFTTIGSYVSMGEDIGKKVGAFASQASEYAAIGNEAISTNLFPSVNNKKDIVPFLLDTLKVVVGTTGLEQLTGELFTSFAEQIEPTIKESIKKQVTKFNSGEPLPNFDVSIKAPDIDIYGKLHTSPESDVGKLIYDNVNINFDSVAYNAIVADGTDVPFNDLLLVNYDSTLDKITFKPDFSILPNPTIGEWFNDYIDKTTFIDPKEFTTNILNGIFGSLTTNQDITIENTLKGLIVDAELNQMINGVDNPELTPDEIAQLMIIAQEKVAGIVTHDMGCGLLKAELPLSGMTEYVNKTSGSTDPKVITDALNDVLKNSFTTAGTEETGDKNKETIRDGFFEKLIKILTNELAKVTTTSPQARMILALSSSFENNGIPQIGDPREDLKKYKVYIDCLIKDAMAALNEFIFALIVGFLIVLLDPIIREVIREKINQYLGIIKSLISSKL